MRSKTISKFVAASIAVALIGAACGDSKSSAPTTTAPSGAATPTTVGVTTTAKPVDPLTAIGIAAMVAVLAISESSTYVARGVAGLARAGDAARWKGSIASARQLADAYGVTDTDGSRPDCWGYIAAYGWERQDGHGIDEFR